MMPPATFAFDLDGTLTGRGESISTENREALEALKRRGIISILATSRPSRCLNLSIEETDLFAAVATCDGASLQEQDKPRQNWATLRPESVEWVLHTLKRSGVGALFALELGVELWHERNFASWPATDSGPVYQCHRSDLLQQEAVARLIVRPTRMEQYERVGAELLANLGQCEEMLHVDFLSAPGRIDTRLLSISSAAANKGASIRRWMHTANIRGPLIAFGDGPNDVTMLQMADAAFLVGDNPQAPNGPFERLQGDPRVAVAARLHRLLETSLGTLSE